MKKSIPLILIFAVLISMWVIYGKVMNPTEDTRAVRIEYKVEIDDYALVLRNEVPVTVNGNGYFQNVVESETKVWAGENIGWFCHGNPDKEVVKQLNLVNQKIREATMSDASDKLLTNDIVSIDNKILGYTKQISSLAAAGDQKAINEIRNELDLLIERKNIILSNGDGSKEGVIETLKKQKGDLEAKLGNSRKNLSAPVSGVFVASADGLENVLTVESVESLTVKGLNKYLKRDEYKADEDVYPYPVCKITDNTSWVLAVPCSEQVAALLPEGKTVTVSFPEEGSKTVKCTVSYKSKADDGEVVVGLMGTAEIYNIFTSRKVKINVLIDSYEGLRVPADAVKFKDDKEYVDVEKSGGIVETEVMVLYRDKEFAIIKEGEKLQIYDKVK